MYHILFHTQFSIQPGYPVQVRAPPKWTRTSFEMFHEKRFEHRPRDKNERKRIEAAGGKVDLDAKLHAPWHGYFELITRRAVKIGRFFQFVFLWWSSHCWQLLKFSVLKIAQSSWSSEMIIALSHCKFDILAAPCAFPQPSTQLEVHAKIVNGWEVEI